MVFGTPSLLSNFRSSLAVCIRTKRQITIARFLAKALCDKDTEFPHTNGEELIREYERVKGIVMNTLIDIPLGKLLEDVKSFPD